MSTKSKKETKCVNMKWEAQLTKSTEDKNWVTTGVNNAELEQKANSCPCADRSRSNYSVLFIPGVRPPLETTN